MLPGVSHNLRELLDALGESNRAFYRGVFGPEESNNDEWMEARPPKHVRETGRLFRAWRGSLAESFPAEWRMLVTGPMLFRGSRATGQGPESG